MAAAIVKVKPGTKHTDLTVLSMHHERANDGHILWLCRCKCGRTTLARGSQLRSGRRKTCGCRPSCLRHGHSSLGRKTKTYTLWKNIRSRCAATEGDDYRDYASRGIRVCGRWKDSFENFLADMGECPPGMQIDRINNNGNYEPGNCRWATGSQNSRNKRNNHLVTYKGRTQCLAAWAEELGIPYMKLYYRICIIHWPIERAISSLLLVKCN